MEIKYLPKSRFNLIYQLAKNSPSWEVIGTDGITESEYKFVVQRTMFGGSKS